MNTIKFTVEGVGDFQIAEELSSLQSARVNLKVSNYFGADYLTLLKHRTELEILVSNQILQEQFPDRSLDSLDADEQKEFDAFVEKDESDTALLYRQNNFQINWITFLFTFPEVCIKSPDSFDFDALVKEGNNPFLQKIWAKYLEALKPVLDKKKASSGSSILVKKTDE